MQTFFVGLEEPSHAWAFKSAMISINRLRNRKRAFRANDWLMDSGAFTEISTHGRWRTDVGDYVKQIRQWATCGNLLAAVSQDYMCEPFILEKTGLSVADHQRLTIERYKALRSECGSIVMPVLQGFQPNDYVKHLSQYGPLLHPGMWVGVGSVCRRNGSPEQIEDVLRAIKQARPDLRLHGFGLKTKALERSTVRAFLHSSDSMAWCIAGWRENGEAHDPRNALAFCARVQKLVDSPTLVQHVLFQMWGGA